VDTAPQFCGLKHDHERLSRQVPLQTMQPRMPSRKIFDGRPKATSTTANQRHREPYPFRCPLMSAISPECPLTRGIVRPAAAWKRAAM
jgi:hypothetical protein